MKHGEDDPPFVFAHIGDTCSICALATDPQHEIEDEAARQFGNVWIAIDKSKYDLGQATPNPVRLPQEADGATAPKKLRHSC